MKIMFFVVKYVELVLVLDIIRSFLFLFSFIFPASFCLLYMAFEIILLFCFIFIFLIAFVFGVKTVNVDASFKKNFEFLVMKRGIKK